MGFTQFKILRMLGDLVINVLISMSEPRHSQRNLHSSFITPVTIYNLTNKRYTRVPTEVARLIAWDKQVGYAVAVSPAIIKYCSHHVSWMYSVALLKRRSKDWTTYVSQCAYTRSRFPLWHCKWGLCILFNVWIHHYGLKWDYKTYPEWLMFGM